MELLERFNRYVQICTTSDELSGTTPSSACQWDLAKVLEQDLKDMGVPKVELNEFCIVYGWLPASPGHEDAPALGLIAHMDTSPVESGKHVRMQVRPDYDGGDVILNDHVSILVKDYPHLPSLKGRTLLTTDGTTLLGADDKAGIAEIMTALQTVIAQQRPHGPLCIAFTPDEEIGEGPDHFDVPHFGAAFAYTVDGGEENILSCETFNAASANVRIHGYSIHPGAAKNIMVNAALTACVFNSMLPAGDTPRHTQGREGFFHLAHLRGDVSEAEMHYIIRDHDRNGLEARKQLIRHAAALLNETYGEGTVEVEMTDGYYNMKEIIDQHPHLIDNAMQVIRDLGMHPELEAVRGGTDGSRLSFMGLPCPNLGTGSYACHGLREHATLEGMELSVKVILGLIDVYAK